MRKIINTPAPGDEFRICDEMLSGYVSAYSKYYEKHPSVRGVILKQRRKDKVALVIGGGSGHEPMFSGFVGKGLADAAACGNMFASPDPETIYKTAKAVDSGKGVLFVYGCYAGDNLNFDMGEEMLNGDGIQTDHVRVMDDVVSAPRERYTDRRGIAGDVFVIKTAGGACDAGLELSEVVAVTSKARDNTYTVGVATAPAELPGVGHPIFELPEGKIEYGMGLHGERGIQRTDWEEADALVERIYSEIMKDADIQSGDEVCVLINGLGSCTMVEMAIAYRKLKELLDRDGIKVHDSDLNSYCTSMEMGGYSITLFKLDDELKRYYDMPCYCPFYAKGAVSEEEADYTPVTEEEEPEFDENDVSQAVITRSREGVLDELCAEDVRNMLIYIADKIIAKKPYLTDIDSAIGDGDHGIGMAGGMQKAKRKLLTMEGEENAYALFEAAGKAMLFSMGGASGVIFGSLYLAGSKDTEAKPVLQAEDLAKMERKSLANIQEKGGASVGDKTMVDALAPAVEALEENSGKGLLEMLKAAEKAAAQGVEDTKKYQAKFGRAKSLMERAIGYQDAGATSVWLIFEGMREYVEDAMS